MLITLREPEYLPVLEQYAEDATFASFVSLLGEILRRGDHAIHSTPRLLDRFSKWPTLSRDQSVALHQTARNVVVGTLPYGTVTDSLVLTGPGTPVPDPEDGPRWHRRPWTWLHRRGRLDATVLAGENLSDACFYRWLGRAWAARSHSDDALWVNIELSLSCRGLGGDTARQEVPEIARNDDPVLCILDSDRNHPAAELGPTARAVSSAMDRLSTDHLTRVEPLPARDIENILPLALVEEVMVPGDPKLRDTSARGFFARPRVDPDLAYIDLGKDQCERRLLDTRDEATREYRVRALAKIRQGDPSILSPADCPRLQNDQPPCGPESKWSPAPECIVVHSIGKKLPRKIVAALDGPSRRGYPHRTAMWLASMLPADDDAAALSHLAHLAWSWGLRSRPLPRL